MYAKGTPVRFETRSGLMTGKFSHMTKTNLCYIHGDDNKPYERVPEKVMKIGEAETSMELTVNGQAVEPKAPKTQFHINDRFKFLESLCRMAIKGTRCSLIITGEGGLGKTYTVKQQVAQSGLVSLDGDPDISDYKFVKGFTTAKGLYNTLYQWNGKLIIFDDCDEVFKNDIATGILKGALDSYDERLVCWVTNKEGGDIPNEFIFTGRIIFISNLSADRMDQAILSRSSHVDLTMSVNDKIERMSNILHAPHFMPKVSKEVKDEAFEVLMQFADDCKNLTMRTLIEVIDYAQSGEEDWKRLAEYTVKNAA